MFIHSLVASLILTTASPSLDPAPPEVRGEGPSIALGLGHAYGLLGVRGEWRFKHLAPGLGVGSFFPLATVSPDISIAPGLRWYFAEPGRSSVFVGAHANLNFVKTWFFAAAVVGYRFQWEHAFLELSAGPAVSYEYLYDRGDSRPPGAVVTFGALGASLPFFPDIGVAFGWKF